MKNHALPVLLRRRSLLHRIVTTVAVMFLPCPTVQAFESTTAFAIKNVSIIDVEAGTLRPHQTVLIEGDRITRVGANTAISVPPDANVVEGADLFLVPGLIDAHVHYMSPETFGPMMIAHGVTLVRDTGAATESILSVREQLRTGKMIGPEMLCTGAIIDGDPPVWPFSEACANAEDAREAVRKLAKAGVDQIKVYSKLSKDAYLAAVAEAHKLGLKAIGHVPLSVSLSEAIEAGQDGIEHLDGFDELIATAAGADVPSPRSFRNASARWDMYAKADKHLLQEAYQRIVKADITICPTIVVMKGIGQAAEPDESDPLMAYVPQFMQTFWSGERYKAMAPGALRRVPLMQTIVHDLHKAGVNLICGTDLANPFVFAGHSLHDEMQLFQAAGIPAKDVLRSATIKSAEFLDIADRLGSIDEGKTASMILTRRNPLEDVRNANHIEGVFLRGRYFNREKLDGLLADARRYAEGTRDSSPKKVDMSLAGKVVRQGTYRSTFNGMDAGTEDFVITKTKSGFSIKAHLQPKGGFQQPSVVTAHYTEQRRVRETTWQQLTDTKLTATYTFAEKVVETTAVMGKTDLPRQRMDLPKTWFLTGPFTSLEFAQHPIAPQTVGETRSFDALGFGFPGWELVLFDYKATRGEDRALETATGKKIRARFYTFALQVPMGTFTGETWTDDTGVVLKSTLTMPFGTVIVTLE